MTSTSSQNPPGAAGDTIEERTLTPSGAPLGDQLITTKLYVPSLGPNAVARRHLTERIAEGSKGKLTLVSAPAGFGKTTLLAEWSLGSASPVAWVSLDEGDNDLGRFLAYLVAALGSLQTGVSMGLLEPLHSPQPPPMESVLTTLVNELAATPEDFTVVLDDYHAIEARPVHEAVAFLLEHMPPRMHVIISSRTDPPLLLARLLAAGHLTRLSAAELRFTFEEAVAFLNEAMGVSLSPGDVATLDERTEGWIAGLQLAALSMQGREDPSDFIAAFTGSNRYVLDYLAEEVLQKQPESVQRFLLETSVLGRLSGPLGDAVTGRSDGQTMLDTLERDNLFVVPLDDERRWFRYHHLFSRFLLKEMQRVEPGAVPDLHRRACDWFEREGLAAEAVSHAFAAGDPERAATLVERVARTTLRRGELSTLRRWLEELSEELVCSRSHLCLYYAWYYLATGRLDAIEPYLDKAERGVRDVRGEKGDARRSSRGGDEDEIRGEVTTIRAAVAGLRGESSRAMLLSRRATELLTEDNQFLQCIIAASQGFAHRNRGDVEAASQAFAEAATLARSADATYVALLAYKQLTELLMVRGRLREAAEVCDRAFGLVAERGERLPASSAAHVGMGRLLREWNELDDAARHLEEGIELGERGGNIEIVFDGHVALARTRRARGDRDGAAEAIGKAKRLAERHGVRAWATRAGAWQARIAAAEGDHRTGARWAEEHRLSLDDELGYTREFEHITLARVLIAGGRHDDALALLGRLLAEAEAGGRCGRVIEILALRAVTLDARPGGGDEALAALGRALALAAPEGYVRLFADEGAPMAALLDRFVRARRGRPPSDVSPEYVSGLLTLLRSPDAPSGGERSRAAASLAEPISEREIEVLVLLASGAPNRTIAAKLFVSLDTVKSHLKHVYSKLSVHNRTQAVTRARELDLID